MPKVSLNFSFLIFFFIWSSVSGLGHGQVAVAVVKRDFLIVVLFVGFLHTDNNYNNIDRSDATRRDVHKKPKRSPNIKQKNETKPQTENQSQSQSQSQNVGHLAQTGNNSHSVFGEILSRADVFEDCQLRVFEKVFVIVFVFTRLINVTATLAPQNDALSIN